MNAAARQPDPFAAEEDTSPRRDPFQARYDDACYFDEAVRAKRLNLLFHLIPYSDVLLVTGEQGSGKTSVLHRLLAGAHDSWRICRFQATAAIDGARLLEMLYKEFSLRPDASDDADQHLRLLRESLYALRHSALVPVLVIDDAHLLTHSALAMLAALTEPWQSKDKLLSVVLFCEPEISKRLIAPGLEPLRARVSHTFDIPPLSEEDTGKYVRHRLQAAGLSSPGPFTDSVLKFIHVASRGFPGRINEFARVVLHNSEQKEAHPTAPASLGSRTKVYLKYGIAGLLASAAAVGLLYQDRLMELVSRVQHTASAPSGSVPPAAIALAPTGDSSPPSSETPPVGTAPMSAGTVAPPNQEMDSATPPEPAPPPDEAAALAEVEEAPAAPEVTDHDQSGAAQPNGSATETGADAGASAEEAAAPPDDSGTVPEVMQHETVVGAVSAAAPTGGMPRDDDWLLAQDPDAYTVQLLVASRAQCLAYLKRHGLGDAAALYQTHSSGQDWSSLVYGIFATEVDATDAGKAISEQDINAKPWVRKVAVVQARIREFRASTPAVPPVPASHASDNNKGVSASPGDIRREPWLLLQSPEAYTLQLFSGKEANVLAYLKRHALSNQVALYQPPDGAGRLTVTYGLYPTRSDAGQAAKELAAQLPDIKPWARPLREIQAILSPGQGADTPPPPSLLPPQINQ